MKGPGLVATIEVSAREQRSNHIHRVTRTTVNVASAEAQQPPPVQHQQVMAVAIVLKVALVLPVILPAVHLHGDPVVWEGNIDLKPPAGNRARILPPALFMRDLLQAQQVKGALR